MAVGGGRQPLVSVSFFLFVLLLTRIWCPKGFLIKGEIMQYVQRQKDKKRSKWVMVLLDWRRPVWTKEKGKRKSNFIGVNFFAQLRSPESLGCSFLFSEQRVVCSLPLCISYGLSWLSLCFFEDVVANERQNSYSQWAYSLVKETENKVS